MIGIVNSCPENKPRAHIAHILFTHTLFLKSMEIVQQKVKDVAQIFCIIYYY